ncbi:hypothetical protein DM01DRAFT_1336015 [Hesseltinella vesiculosa]|uniref:Uncharacterized protein n=1 Tax=Hesseltinella vesiculosa TaxID=101127 RepID=A0A1X2GGU9_9FUNG|nr:hypothetical protein DM01DRAFT_1336015 [Hesseltinella vesiculosa]
MTTTSPTATPSPSTIPTTSEDDPMPPRGPVPVQAYAKLEGEDFCYYIRTLQVTLGRKATKPDNVDIPLGNTKSVSRQHARLFYNFATQRFEMMVFGKNGAFVNERFIERGVTVPLENRTKIQIGEVAFVFLLPRLDMDDLSALPHHHSFPRPIQTRSSSDEDDPVGPTATATPRQLEKHCLDDEPTMDPTAATSPPSSKHTPSKASSEKGRPKKDKDDKDDRIYGNKNDKPPYSYASLIAQAICSCSEKKMTLSGIYSFITTNFPYYQMTQNGWQNSIRHNLSLNKAFIKVPRNDNEPGKGAFWAIDPGAEAQFLNGIYRRNKRAGPPNKGSDPSTPTDPPKKRVKKEDEPTHASLASDMPEEDHIDPDSTITTATTDNASLSDQSKDTPSSSTSAATPMEDVQPSPMRRVSDVRSTPPLSSSPNTSPTSASTSQPASSTLSPAPSSPSISSPPLSKAPTAPSISPANVSTVDKKDDIATPVLSPSSAATAALSSTTPSVDTPSPPASHPAPSSFSTPSDTVETEQVPAPLPDPAVSAPASPLTQKASTVPSVVTPAAPVLTTVAFPAKEDVSAPSTTPSDCSSAPTQAAAAAAAAVATAGKPPAMTQAQLQLHLQNTIRQHLLDPIRHPLPPSIAQLLPQAIAQLPPTLQNQLSTTLQNAMRAHELHKKQQASTASAATAPTTTSADTEAAKSSATSTTATTPSTVTTSPKLSN